VALLVLLALIAATPAAAGHVNVVTIAGSINPASSDHLQKAIAQSETEGAVALLIELDTPGGLLSSTKDIIQAMLNARVPVVVFVSPRGAWAASAGTFITLAAHVAAMAPGTSIGAASPVSVTGGGGERDEDDQRRDVAAEKAEKFTTAFIESIAKERKRNVEWAMRSVREAEAIAQDEALELGVIDLVAQNRADLLKQLDGMEVIVDGESRRLEVAGAEVRVIEMAWLTRVFNFLASPDIAVLLAMAGLLGLYIEFNQPGTVLPGILGAGCLVLAAIAFQILPFSWVGLLLMLLGVGLLVLEIFVISYGLLFADVPELSDLTVSFWSVLVPITAAFALFGGLVVFAVGRTFRRKQTAGVSELIGMIGTSQTALAPEGRVFLRGEYWTASADEEVFLRGEYWTASADEEIPAGERVEVVAVEGMRLRVRRA
jgi:membrane-bound serine protease (ClpP class)